MLKFRPDRIVTLGLFYPLQRLAGPRPGIPILMYHSISREEERGRGPYFRTCTDPTIFENQIKYLARNGYEAINLDEAIQRIEAPSPNARKAVVLTFDDGYEDFYTEAFPVLSAFRYTATVFLPTAYIGDTAQAFNGTECLTWSHVRELQNAGIEFGSHTVTHPQLATLPKESVKRELWCSRTEVEDRLGAPVRSFSYPYAFPEANREFKREFREMLIAAGYCNGVSTIIGRLSRRSDRCVLERLPVNSGDDSGFLKAKLEGGYDWLHTIQLTSKMWKPQLRRAAEQGE